ncbi:MAG: Glycosyl transferase family 2 [Candidatus Levybacteria bacterium GW2011_GWA2_40_8]|nr:MAG: Glycosyl transferase family 2 [Candidatus Levybacteria bacterium GW2011_GWA2_40_8]
MKNKPLISIVLPVCDAEKYLRDCVRTIKRQSYKNFEVIAVDDASKDRSYHMLKQTRKRDKRFRVYKNKNRYGLSITLNRALRRAKGDYIAFMDPNSKNYYHRLKSQLSYLLENPKVGAVGAQRKLIKSKSRVVSESNFPTEHEDIQKNLLSSETIQPETLMINKTLLPRDLLKFDSEPYPFLYTNLLMKIGNYAKVENLERPLLYLRKYRKNYHIDIENVGKTVEFVKLWFKTRATHDQKPPIKSLFTQVLGAR